MYLIINDTVRVPNEDLDKGYQNLKVIKKGTKFTYVDFTEYEDMIINLQDNG